MLSIDQWFSFHIYKLHRVLFTVFRSHLVPYKAYCNKIQVQNVKAEEY